MSGRQKILFLQGPPNSFWWRFARGLNEKNVDVLKVNINLADQVFWPRKGATNYRGSFDNWAAWLHEFMARHDITDVVYYADQHPYHKVAFDISTGIGVNCWAIEFGYLRPDWLTFERDGMGPMSRFPRSRPQLEALAQKFPVPDMICRYPHKFIQEAVGEVVYHLLQSFGRPFFPRFHSDKIYLPIVDYLSWIPEFFRQNGQRKKADEVVKSIAKTSKEFWLVALQIHADYQIRSHSPYDHQEEMLADIFSSFQKSNETGDLVIKIHPLDNGMENWPKRVARQAREHGLSGRVHLIKGGDLGGLIATSEGVIIANSTVGLHSIAAGKPTLVMGDALFDIHGLTHQSGLDSFWRSYEYPDSDFYEVYRRALGAIQIKGSFYNRAGQRRAVQEMVQRLMNPAGMAKNPLQAGVDATILAAE